MYDTEGNEHYIGILDYLLNYRQHHQHIHLKENKPVLQYINLKFVFFGKYNRSAPPISTFISVYMVVNEKQDLHYKTS